jgi:hypothetical protein
MIEMIYARYFRLIRVRGIGASEKGDGKPRAFLPLNLKLKLIFETGPPLSCTLAPFSEYLPRHWTGDVSNRSLAYIPLTPRVSAFIATNVGGWGLCLPVSGRRSLTVLHFSVSFQVSAADLRFIHRYFLPASALCSFGPSGFGQT